MGITERKEREKERRRQEIIDAAEEVFFSKGFDSATVDDVAERAELSKGTVYLYFKSKEDLQFAVFQRGADLLISDLKKSVSETQNGLENLVELANAFILFSKQNEDYFKLFTYFHSADLSKLNIEEGQLQQYMVSQSPLAVVAQIVEKGIKDKSLRQDIDPVILTSTLWSQMLGLLVILYNKKRIYEMFGVDQNEIILTHFELIRNGGKNK